MLIDSANGSPVTESVAEANRVTDNCDIGTGPSLPAGNSDDDLFVLPENGNECANVADQEMVPNSSYCNVFHVCLGGRRKDFRCAKASTRPYDLWWNDETKRCDWPCNVRCGKQIFDDVKDAVAILALDRDNCVVIEPTHSTVLPGYGRK